MTTENAGKVGITIAKYRVDGDNERWFLTNFTMEQVEGRLADLTTEVWQLKRELTVAEEKIKRLEEERNHLGEMFSSFREEGWGEIERLEKELTVAQSEGILEGRREIAQKIKEILDRDALRWQADICETMRDIEDIVNASLPDKKEDA